MFYKELKKKSISALLVACMSMSIMPITAKADNPIVQTYYTADPAPLVTSDDVFYCYTGHDEDIIENGFGQTYNFFTMKDWRAYSTTDMVNWTDHGTILKLSDFSWADQDDARAWASQMIERDGMFYFYTCAVMSSAYKQQNNVGGYFGIGVAVADNPNGPFTDPLGKPLIAAGGFDIDPTVYIDDDGQAYLYYGQNPLRYVLLNEDMISYNTSIGIVSATPADIGLEGYIEGPWLYARTNDYNEKLYYMSYAGGGASEDIRYATSDSPLGPWNYGGILMNPTSLSAVDDGKTHSSFTIHGGIVDYKDHSYFIYHNAALANGQGYHRSTAIEEFSYNPDGSIDLIEMTLNDRKAIDTLNPYTRVEAETICWEYGIKTYDEINPQGTIDVQVYNTHNNDYIKLESVDFGDLGASTFTASVKNVAEDANASIELYIKDNDSIEGINSLMVTDSDKIGTLSLKNASGSDWNERTTFLTKKVTGVHDLYLVFKGDYEKPEAEQDPSSVISEDDTGMFHFDYWKFGEIEPPATPTPIPTVTTAPSPTAPSLNTTEPSVTPKVELKLTKGNIRSIKNNKSKKITLTLKKIKNAVGYEVTLATKSNFKTGRIKKTTKSTSITFSKCKKGKTYYARVRGYYVNESGKKKYGAYSGVKKIKVNK